MNDAVYGAVSELKNGLGALYSDRLLGVFIYGSYARGEEVAGSDLDVMIVLDRIVSYGDEIDRSSVLIASLSLKHDVSISRVFVTEDGWRDTKSPFLLQVRREAIAA